MKKDKSIKVEMPVWFSSLISVFDFIKNKLCTDNTGRDNRTFLVGYEQRWFSTGM